ncbi:MAG: hypothetical protein IJ845_09920 [Bacteroidaceae bacterium]|nr:hypothetical protein [Bacteroidaceae bacterium]
MTINELNTSKWQDFAFDLVDAKEKQILEQPYQERIEAAFRALGWSKAKGEICPKERINVGANNQLEPDITFRINGKPVFIVEVKQPNNKLTERQKEQLLSYMRMRQVVLGLYIGEEIQLLYDNGDSLPTSVMTINIDTEATNGWMFIDFFARGMFSYERIRSYCEERYKEIHSNRTFEAFAIKLDKDANGAIKELLLDYFVTAKKCDDATTIRFLKAYNFQVIKTNEETSSDQSSYEANSEIVTRYVLKHRAREQKTGRDRTKYSIDGGKTYFGKGRFVREIVATYLSANPDLTFNQLAQVFPDELQGSYGVVRSLEDIYKSDHDLKDLMNRYVMDDDKILTTKDGVQFVVCNQWGRFNFQHILEKLDKWGWNVLNDKE